MLQKKWHLFVACFTVSRRISTSSCVNLSEILLPRLNPEPCALDKRNDGRTPGIWAGNTVAEWLYWLLFLIIVAFQCQILTTKMEISTFTVNAVALVVLCIGNGIPVRTSVPGKSQVVFNGKFETLQPNLLSFCNSADRNCCGFSSHIKSIFARNQT